MTATDRNHAKADVMALQRLLKIVGATSLDHRDGRTEVMEAIHDQATPRFIADLTGALYDAIDGLTADDTEVGRIVRAHVMERMRAHPKFESYFLQAVAELDEQDREEAEADEQFERESAQRRGLPYIPPTAA